MQLRESERNRACDGYTVVVRPNVRGRFVATVRVEDCAILFSGIVQDGEVHREIASQLRLAAKCGFTSDMNVAARRRMFKDSKRV